MAFATSARHGLSYVAETAFGTTPATPSMLNLRNTSVGLNLAKDTFVSAEIRSDRQIADLRHGVKKPAGDIGFELSYGAFDDFLAAALFGDWVTDTLKAGVVLHSFTMERLFADIGQYQVFTGAVVNQMKLTIVPNDMVKGTFSLLAKDSTASGTSLGAPTDVATFDAFDGFSGTITEGGTTIATVSSLDLTLDNNISPTFVVGANTTPQMVPGQSNLTGTVTAYFADATMLNKFINETESSIALTLEDTAGNSLAISIPRVKYTGGELPVQDTSDPIMLNMPFQALRDDTAGTNLSLTRTAAV